MRVFTYRCDAYMGLLVLAEDVERTACNFCRLIRTCTGDQKAIENKQVSAHQLRGAVFLIL